MSASNEWTEWHLTPRGWERGTEKEDFRRIDRERPTDRVWTTKWIEQQGHAYGNMQAHEANCVTPHSIRRNSMQHILML